MCESSLHTTVLIFLIRSSGFYGEFIKIWFLQGTFAQCRKVPEGSSGVKYPVHHFHKQCQVLRNGRYFCPHCGEESEQFEVTLQLDEPRNMTNFEDKYNKPQ